MNIQGGVMAVFALVVCLASRQYGQWRRQTGRPVTPRVVVSIMAVVWALGWFFIGVGAMLAAGPQVPWTEGGSAFFPVLGVATVPPLLILGAAWLPGFLAGEPRADKKVTEPHPLD